MTLHEIAKKHMKNPRTRTYFSAYGLEAIYVMEGIAGYYLHVGNHRYACVFTVYQLAQDDWFLCNERRVPYDPA